MQPAISIRGLGKSYRITHEGRGGYRTLRESMTDVAAAPLRWARKRREGGGAANGAGVEEFWALKDLNVDIKPGEVVGVIGHNGAGKSTLLKIISRITKPSVGEIVMRGRVGSLLEVGTGFHPELTGRENIFLNGAILGMM
jgi:lipopolysaccharide transport system ATP-binding protein